MKTFDELQKMDLQKLIEELTLLRKELVKIEFELVTGQEKNNHKRTLHRKQIARANTLIQRTEKTEKAKSAQK